jgi:hypothetical protein
VLKQTHTLNKWGGGGKSHAETIKKWADEIGACTILDYGCGRSTLKDAIDIPVQEYDPGITGKDKLPSPADLVVATDVFEHIESEFVHNVLHHVRSLTIKGAYFVISLRPAKMILPDGRNAHLTIMPAEWWLEMLRKHDFNVVHHSTPKGLWVWAKV